MREIGIVTLLSLLEFDFNIRMNLRCSKSSIIVANTQSLEVFNYSLLYVSDDCPR